MSTPARNKMRLDQLVFERGLSASREEARRLILAGQVLVADRVSDKAGRKVDADAEIRVKERPRFVSRGGLKLEGALDCFQIDPRDRVCFDVGASTGGFTDLLLQRGAKRVYAFDVGTNQLAWKIRSDPRVVVKEKFNIRHMTPEDVGEQVDLIVADVSFISLRLILPPCLPVLRPGGNVVVLIKPQFELSREEIGKGGIVRDPVLQSKAVGAIKNWCETETNLTWQGSTASSITGADGNQEYLAWMK